MGNAPNKEEKMSEQMNICNKRGEDKNGNDDSDSISTMDSPEHEIMPQQKRRTAVFAENMDPTIDRSDEPYEIYPKSEEQKTMLRKAIKHVVIFSQLSDEDMNAVVDAMFERTTKPGEKIITEGENGDNFYVIMSGNFDIYIKGKKLGSYEGAGSFGELALLYNTERAATVTSTGVGHLWAMTRNSFRRIVLTQAYNRRKRYEHLLDSVQMFKCLDGFERMNVCDSLTSEDYKDGDLIIKEGDPGRQMFFIEKGEVRIMKMINDKNVEIKRLYQNDYFGELALHTQRPRAASVFAVGDTTVAVLQIESFERLLGPCLHVLKRDMVQYEKEFEKVFSNPNTLEPRRDMV